VQGTGGVGANRGRNGGVAWENRAVVDTLRKAASLIAVREGPIGGPEILVLERGGGSRFLPGYVAFPGGAVDEEDEALAARWFGDANEAARAAAIRELVEEAGLGITAGGMIEVASIDPLHATPPHAEQLTQIAHWIAPDEVPVRFDARFFATAAPQGLTPEADGGETAAAWWVAPDVLIAEWEAGARKLYWPTYFTMTKLAECRTVADLLTLRFETREPTEEEEAELPRSVFFQE
jgi:8-oxo-dGTP pyrophosphatase MutT (NUDIX family)